MDLHIMAMDKAVLFQPTKPTYAIRIFGTGMESKGWWEMTMGNASGLKPSYLHIAEYTFDNGLGAQPFDDTLAERILKEFIPHKDKIEALLVHCTAGISRSPAVAIALNDIFGLGADSCVLAEKYHLLNKGVYHKLLETAERLHLNPPRSG